MTDIEQAVLEVTNLCFRIGLTSKDWKHMSADDREELMQDCEIDPEIRTKTALAIDRGILQGEAPIDPRKWTRAEREQFRALAEREASA